MKIGTRNTCHDSTFNVFIVFRALFPCGDNMVCIIDDREDVWSHASNLIHVKPYHFFQHTGDINAPPGLDKHDQDDKAGIDLSKLVTKNGNDAEDNVDNLNGKEEKDDKNIENIKENPETHEKGNGVSDDLEASNHIEVIIFNSLKFTSNKLKHFY